MPQPGQRELMMAAGMKPFFEILFQIDQLFWLIYLKIVRGGSEKIQIKYLFPIVTKKIF